MNQLDLQLPAIVPSNTNTAPGPTMSSIEIAERTGKRHDNVMRDIRRNLIELYGEGGLLKFEDTHHNPQNGQAYPIYRLPKRETLVVVSNYSTPLRAAIIDRWLELEGQVARPDPVQMLSDPEALRGILLTYTEQVIALKAENEQMKPAVAALERIAEADGSLCITDAAKTLQVRPKALFSYLREHRWIYRRGGSATDIGYQGKLATGLLEHKTTTITTGDGTEKVTTQVRITPKGLAALGKLLPPVAEAA